ncbi:MAG: DnaD domain protein [Anaerolineaceae bacterium]|nr:DnaD domain protein [Anaerolineaceae bacterium]
MPMSLFKGFSAKENDSIPVPAAFFTDLLPQIEHLGELRISLYAFWNLHTQAKEPRYLLHSDILHDANLVQLFGSTRSEQEENLQDALDRACLRGTLLKAQMDGETYYFINSPRGKAARDGLMAGAWKTSQDDHVPARLAAARPSIFALYEQNIGPLTPILSQMLQEAEDTYPADWIEEAVKIAVTRNARNWNYVEAILKSWKEKGRNETDRRAGKEDRKRDSEGKYADFIKH